MNSNKFKAYVAAFLYALIVGFAFLSVKISLRYSSPLDALAHRFTLSFLGAFLLLITGVFPKLELSKKDVIKILPLGIFYPALSFGFQVFGLNFMASSEAAIIQATTPIFTMILAGIFLSEHTNFKQKASVLISVAGVIYIFSMKGSSLGVSDMKGIFWMILSCIAFGGYSVMARPLTKKYKATSLTFVTLVVGAIFFNVLALSNHIVQGNMSEFLTPLKSNGFLIATFYLGTISTLGTSLLSNYALTHLEASKVSVFNNLSTLFSILAGIVFLKEKIYYFHMIGALMIIFGVLGTSFFGKTKKIKEKSEFA